MSGRHRMAMVVLAALLAAGCGADDRVEREPRETDQVEQAPTAALDVAEQFTRASRVTIPEQLRGNHAEQLRHATGALEAELRRVGPPTPAQVKILQSERTGSNIDVLEVEGELDGADAASVRVAVRERQWSGGALNESSATYDVHLVERGNRWLVDQFTIDV